MQGVDRIAILIPETRTRSADVPVRQRLGELTEQLTGSGDIADIHGTGEIVTQYRELRQNVAIQHMGGIGAPPTDLRGVQRQEAIGVPQRQLDLANTFADALFGDDQIPAAEDRRSHQEPAHGIGAVPIEHLVDVGIVTQRFAHLRTVVTEHDSVRHAGFECRPVEQCRRQNMQRVKPAPGLSDVLDDEVAGIMAVDLLARVGGIDSVEPLFILERVMHLGIGHGTRVEPHVEDVFDPSHR